MCYSIKEKINEFIKLLTLKNLKENWYFPVSAAAFFCISMDNSLGYILGIPIALTISVLISSYIPSIKNYVFSASKKIRVICMLSSLGVCLGNQEHFYEQTQKLMLSEDYNVIFLIISFVGALASFAFVFICTLVLLLKITELLGRGMMLDDFSKGEKLVYVILIVLSITYSVLAFSKTQAFYGTEHNFDIIYTSDSPALVKSKVYFSLTNNENDLRQPLFAVFSAPFLGIPYLIGRVLVLSDTAQAILLNCIQIIMLLFANLLLAKIMQLSSVKRICFMLICCSSYTYLLFSLMMEQYIVAYFWLVLCVYSICQNKPDRIALYGAGGSMLTSMALVLGYSDKSIISDFKGWLSDIVKQCFGFVFVMLAFCRFDVFWNLAANIAFLGDFTGKKITIHEKLYQYSNFIRNCFIAPDTIIDEVTVGHASWQLSVCMEISIIGVIIFTIAVIGYYFNRHNKISAISFCWLIMTFVLLVVLGWGTQENGLILYSLYFGWAILVLFFQMFEHIEKKCNVKFIIPVFSIIVIIYQIADNLPAIKRMLEFAAEYFPA